MQFFLAPRFFIIALVVGSLLNLINQGDAILAGEKINYLKICFTYCVPYLVASFSAWTTVRHTMKVGEQ